ncbi:MAG: DUF3352 domain-containing protein [Phycisphaerales bacterium]|nr:DUF3352 domain-containing protein [Phycisphaerales bacterium]
MMKRTWFVAAVVLLLALTRGLFAAPLDNRIPADAIAYVGWQGVDALAGPYAQSNLKGFIDSSKLPEFLTENWPKWMAAANHGDEQVAQQTADSQALLMMVWRHPTAVYVGPVSLPPASPLASSPASAPAASPNTPPSFKVAILCDAGADAPVIEQLIKRLNAADPPPPEAKFAITRDGNVVIITLGGANAAMFAPGDPATRITGAPAYLSATKSLRPNAALTVFVNAEKTIAAFSEIAPPPKTDVIILRALGLDALTYAAYTGSFDGKDWRDDLFIGIKGTRTGIPSLLAASPLSDDALKMIPKGAVAFSAGRFDFVKTLAQVRGIAKQLAPGNAQAFEQGLAQANAALGIDLEKDLINAFGDEWILYRAPRTEEMTANPFVFVQKLRDSVAIEKTLAALAARITAMSQGKIAVETLDTGTIKVSGVRLPMLTLAWTVRGGVFYVSTLEGISDAVEQVEKKGPSILENPSYLAVRKTLPTGKASTLSYYDTAKLYPDMYQIVMGSVLPMVRMSSGLDIPGDLIPAPRRVAPFMSAGGGIGWADADGYHYSSRACFPGAQIISGQTNIAVPALTAAIVLPSLAKAKELANRSSSAANLRGIGNSCVIWAAQNNDQMPDHLGRLVLDGLSPKILVSKRTNTEPLVMTPELEKLGKTDFEAFAKKVDEHCDYLYFGKGTKSSADATVLLACEKPGLRLSDGINLGFADVHVDFVRYQGVRAIVEESNRACKAYKFPTIDIDALLKDSPVK